MKSSEPGKVAGSRPQFSAMVTLICCSIYTETRPSPAKKTTIETTTCCILFFVEKYGFTEIIRSIQNSFCVNF